MNFTQLFTNWAIREALYSALHTGLIKLWYLLVNLRVTFLCICVSIILNFHCLGEDLLYKSMWKCLKAYPITSMRIYIYTFFLSLPRDSTKKNQVFLWHLIITPNCWIVKNCHGLQKAATVFISVVTHFPGFWKPSGKRMHCLMSLWVISVCGSYN